MHLNELENLLNRYHCGTCDEKEIKLLEDFFEAYQIENNLQEISPDEEDQMKLATYYKIMKRIKVEETKRSDFFFNRALKMACFVLLLIVVSAIGHWSYENWAGEANIEWKSKTVGYGQKASIMLSDGTFILLNSGSTIEYPEKFHSNERHISLSGEAYFEVAKEASRPFVIKTGKISTTVLGTSFNINAYSDKDITVTVATGKVRVAKAKGKQEVFLTPGEQARYHGSQGSIIRKATVDTERFFAWQNNTIQFENTTLENAANILERWYNVKILFRSPQMRHCTISGTYKNENLINILESIRFVKDLDYKFDDNNVITLFGKACER